MKTTANRVSRSMFTGALALGMTLLAGAAQGKTKLPSPYSPATTACIHQAVQNERSCKLSAAKGSCKAQYHTDFANCFAAGAGVACATACETAKTACDVAPLGVEKTCVKACKTTLLTAIRSCAVGDVTCSAAAQTAYVGCRKACTSSPAIKQCGAAFAACLKPCPNL